MQDPPCAGYSPGYARYILLDLFNLNLLPVQERIVYKILLITFKSLNGQTHHILVILLTCIYLQSVTLKCGTHGV